MFFAFNKTSFSWMKNNIVAAEICTYWHCCSLNYWYFHPKVSFGTSSLFAASQSLGKIARTVQKALIFVPGFCGCVSWGGGRLFLDFREFLPFNFF
ncbi:hypothetical protein Nmel_009973 [Mimus melanotis]